MERNGWVEEDTRSSGKEKSFILTDRGRELIEKIKPLRQEVQQRLMSALTDEELGLLLNLCNKLKAVS
jgi:DNA-binding MarR family transcriptional regulator